LKGQTITTAIMVVAFGIVMVIVAILKMIAIMMIAGAIVDVMITI